MFAIKYAAHLDFIRLGRLQRELLKYGYPESDVSNTIDFLDNTFKGTRPLLYDVRGPDWLFHLTTCDRAPQSIQLVTHHARRIRISAHLLSGADKAQCTFDFKGCWPESLFQYQEFDPLTTLVGQNAPRWLMDHQDTLLSISSQAVTLDLARFTPLLDAYTSYPFL